MIDGGPGEEQAGEGSRCRRQHESPEWGQRPTEDQRGQQVTGTIGLVIRSPGNKPPGK